MLRSVKIQSVNAINQLEGWTPETRTRYSKSKIQLKIRHLGDAPSITYRIETQQPTFPEAEQSREIEGKAEPDLGVIGIHRN